MKRDTGHLVWIILLVVLSLVFSIAMAVALIWAMRVFGVQIDYSWQSVLAVWLTMVVIKGIFNKVKE